LALFEQKGQVWPYRAELDECPRFNAWVKTGGFFVAQAPAMLVFADGKPLGMLSGEEVKSFGGVSGGLSRMLAARHMSTRRISGMKGVSTPTRSRSALDRFDERAYAFYASVERRHMRSEQAQAQTRQSKPAPRRSLPSPALDHQSAWKRYCE